MAKLKRPWPSVLATPSRTNGPPDRGCPSTTIAASAIGTPCVVTRRPADAARLPCLSSSDVTAFALLRRHFGRVTGLRRPPFPRRFPAAFGQLLDSTDAVALRLADTLSGIASVVFEPSAQLSITATLPATSVTTARTS